MPHDFGQYSVIHVGFSAQPPASAHAAHWYLVSRHTGKQTPQWIGHSRSIISGFSAHCPARAHAAQFVFVSAHSNSHTLHVSGQWSAMNSALLTHSLFWPQLPQSGCLSVQMPPSTRVARAENMFTGEEERPRSEVVGGAQLRLSAANLAVTPSVTCSLHAR